MGERIFRYDVYRGKDKIYQVVTTHLSQDYVLKQLETNYKVLSGLCRVYLNGEFLCSIGQKNHFKWQIRCEQTGEVYNSLIDMSEKTGFKYKYCEYLVNRTRKYNYIE